MTQDEINEMARQSGCIPRRHPEYWEDVQVFATPDVLVAFAKLVAEKQQRTWVGLTVGDIPDNRARNEYFHQGAEWAEQLLKQRNT